jgi:chromosomal replication initiation ATPase DnaA
VQTVARVFNVEMDLMRLPTRGRARVALARQVAMYLAHVRCGLSLTEAGELFDRDRTTVAHACHIVEARREDPGFDRAIALLERTIAVLAWPREVACQACK